MQASALRCLTRVIVEIRLPRKCSKLLFRYRTEKVLVVVPKLVHLLACILS
jgi:hypothetical protein